MAFREESNQAVIVDPADALETELIPAPAAGKIIIPINIMLTCTAAASNGIVCRLFKKKASILHFILKVDVDIASPMLAGATYRNYLTNDDESVVFTVVSNPNTQDITWHATWGVID